MVTLNTANTEATNKAKLRALSEGVQVLAVAGDFTRFICPSKSHQRLCYEVKVHSNEPGDLSCDCPAGSQGRLCKHIGGVMLRMQLEMERAEAVAEASAEQDMVNGLPRDEFERRIAELF